MVRAPRPPSRWFLALSAVLALSAPGCSQFGTRQRLEESRRMIQTLRAENAQIKGQMLSYRNLNRDYSERAVDDARRLAQQEEAIEHLERSVQAYQRERDDLRTAFRELRDNLPDAVRSALAPRSDIRAASLDAEPEAEIKPIAKVPRARSERPAPTQHERKTTGRDTWAPTSTSAWAVAETDAGP